MRKARDKKEQRAVQLFEYIQRCEDLEKERRRKELSEIVASQRKRLDEKTKQLVRYREEEKKRVEEERRRRLKEKRDFLVSLARKDPHQTIQEPEMMEGSLVIQEELEPVVIEKQRPKLYKSMYYKQQSHDLSYQRNQEKYLHDELIMLKQKAMQTVLRVQSKPEPKVLPAIKSQEALVESKPSSMVFQSDAEVQAFMERYTREDSPIPPKQFIKQEETHSSSSLEKTISMLESLKKHKSRTKHLTMGQMNQYGFVSAISEDFESGFQHGRTMEDVVWTRNSPENPIVVPLQDPLEYKLMMDPKEFEKKERVSRTEKIIDIDEMGPTEPVPEARKEERETKEVKAVEIVFSEGEKKMIEKADSELQSSRGSGFLNKRARTFNLKIRTKPLIGSVEPINEPVLLSARGGSSDDQPFPLTAIINGEYEPGLLSPLQYRARSKTVGLSLPSPTPSETEHRRKRSISVYTPSPGQSKEKLEVPKPESPLLKTIARRSTLSAAKSRPETPKRVSVYAKEPPTLDPEPRLSTQSDGTIYANPFGSMFQMVPEYNAMPTLADWHKKITNQEPLDLQQESWGAINLDAVADFGKTVYTRELLGVANAAETIEKKEHKYRPSKKYWRHL